MASPHIAIAKATLAAALFRADNTVLNRDSIAEFHKLLEVLLSACSASNVQKCKDWLLHNIVPSPTRTGALGKYLASLAKHLQQLVKKEPNGQTETCNPSTSRKRLHIFYLLNDLLHHAKYHSRDAVLFSTFSSSLQPFLVDMVQTIASDCKSKVSNRMFELLGLWERDKYYAADYISKLKDLLDTTEGSESSKAYNAVIEAVEPEISSKDLPFLMPSTHGDPSVPYFDLPAGNLMPHILPNSSAAIRPDQVRALQFVPGPADDGLVYALKDFLEKADNITNSTKWDESADIIDVDDLGQVCYQDENGESVGGDTYYGWSRSFCEKMKKRREGGERRETRASAYSSSRSPSRSRNRSPRKRRRYSDSVTSRSVSRSRSSRSRGPRNGQREDSLPQRTSRDYRRRSRSRSYSPEQPNPMSAQTLSDTGSRSHRGFYSQLPPPPLAPSHPPPFHMLPNQISFQPPLGPGGVPLPPPPPPIYSGSWPANMNFPPTLPFPVPPPQQGGTFHLRPGPPGPSQNWSSGDWQGNS